MAPRSEKSQKDMKNDKPKIGKASKKIFKPKREQNNTAKSEAFSLQLEDEVPNFPRGFQYSFSRYITFLYS